MSSVSIRMARLADHAAYARLFPELGVDDPIPDADAFKRKFMPDMLVAEEQGHVIGFIWYESTQSPGYVRQLVVDPASRRQGLGRKLMLEVADRFRKSGYDRWCLNVKPDNLPAVSLYRQLGMSEAYRSTALRLHWSMVHALPEAGESSLPVSLSQERTAIVEQSLGLVAGQLARAVQAGDRVVMELQDPSGSSVGVAAFDRAFPGAFPFRVKEDRWAKPLLIALEPHACPEVPYLQIVAESDSNLVRLLRSHGAMVRLEIVHLEGSLEDAR
jgi:GNAT superfamily N-acetyltransferase